MRVYISGGITDVEDYKKKFADAEQALYLEGHQPFNPTKLDFPNLDYEEYMRLDFCLLDMCDAIYMLKGWENSRGANREFGYALASRKVIMNEVTIVA